MEKLLKNGTVFLDGKFIKSDIKISNNTISDISPIINVDNDFVGIVYDFSNCYIFPGLLDVHVHLREPGFSHKETIKSGTMSAARGGFTHVCSMPNLSPVPHSLEALNVQLELIKKDAVINVTPFGAITVGEKGETLADLEVMAPYVAGFSDDGRGVQSSDMMESAMLIAKKLDKPIVAHCEDESLLFGGYIHDGKYAKENNHKGISSESEWVQIERDIKLADKTKVKYHICHMSTKEGVELVRNAKEMGVDVTAETAPHYLMFCDTDIEENGRFKMNPPIRSAEDRDALINGLASGAVDMIITDHAPHTAQEKSQGLKSSAMGVVGLETSFAASYTTLVKTGKITLEKLIELMHTAPKKRFNIGRDIKIDEIADLTVFSLEESYTVDPEEFLTMGRATPFAGVKLYGVCKMTMVNGEVIYKEDN